MLLDIIKKGSVDRSVELRIIDSTDGTPELGVVFNTSGIDLWYRREGAAKVSITEVTLAALTTAHSDGGFLHISDGVYRLDLPDAAFATGANQVSIGGAVTGMVVIGGRVRLVDYDPEAATNLGLTNLDATTSSRATPAQVATELTTYGALKPTTAGRTLDVTATGEAGLDYANTAGTPADPTGVGTLLTRMGTPSDVGGGATLSANLVTIEAQTDDIGAAGAGLTALGDTRIANLDATVSSRAAAALFTGITSVAQWLGLIAGKQTGNSTARTEIRATGAGSGGFDEVTDSQEAIRDRGDVAWITGAGGDPWATAVPGAYGAGTAGNILGNRLDAAVSTRATPAQVATELTTYAALKPTTAGRTLDVTATGEAGIDWANIGAPTTAQTLSGTTVGTVTTLTNDPAGVTTLLTRIPAALFSGITSLGQWLGLLAGKQVGNATARTEIRATGAGSGTFDEVFDSQEALRDNMGTPQTGDSFARIGANGAGLTALGDTRIANLDATISSRATPAQVATELNTYGALKPTVAARTLDVSTTGEAGIDWANVGSPTTAQTLSGTTVGTATNVGSTGVDSIWAKAMTEISGIPAITASVFDAIRWVFTASRNKNTQTATTQIVRNDADSSNIASATVSDDGTTFTRGKFS